MKILDMFNSEMSMKEIADKYGTTRSAIAGLIGRARRKGELYVKDRDPHYVEMIKARFAPELVPDAIDSEAPTLTDDESVDPADEVQEPDVKPKRKRVRLRIIEHEKGLLLIQLKPYNCKYPIEDDPDFRFCGCLRCNKSPYCPDHTRLCYRPNTVRDRSQH
jgi:hypothetical protein